MFFRKLFSFLLALIAAGCATAKTDWESVRKQDTSCSYEEFLRTHPASEFAASAKARMEQMEWESAVRQNTAEALHAFLSQYPDSKFSPRALDRLESLAWEQARAKDIAVAYRTFLMDHPQGRFALQAREELDWETARAQDTTDAYREFVSYHEAGRHAEDAQSRIDELAWRAASARDTAESYQAYLSEYPDGRFAKRAKKAVDLRKKLAACKPVSHAMSLQIGREITRFIGTEDGGSLITRAVDFRVSRFGLSDRGERVSLTDYVSAGKEGGVTSMHYVLVSGSRAGLPVEGEWYPSHQIARYETVVQPGSTIVLRDGRQFIYGDDTWHQCGP